jgi:PAS domain S-box-containing protein
MRMPEGDREPWRVVIVDDDADDRANLRRLLLRGADRRYKFDEAETAAGAIEAIRRPGRPPDCALIDYHLPDGDAREVLVTCSGAGGAAICPALVLTGSTSREEGREVLKAGAQDFLGKDGLTAQSLTRAVENAVDRYWLTSQLRQRDAVIRENEARLRLALDSSNTGLWTWDLASDDVVWSPEVYTLLGIPEGSFETTATAFFALVHPDDRSRVDAAVGEALARHTQFECEFRILRPDGAMLWVENRGRARYLPSGEPIGMLGTVTDVSGRKAIEEQLRRREFELRTLTDNTPDLLARFDRELRHVFVNAAVEKATGWPREKFIGKTNRELGMPAELCDQWEAGLRAVIETGKDQFIKFAYQGPLGTQHYSAHLVGEVGADGSIDQFLAVTHDVTEHENYEQALRDNARRKDEFLATLAHELRNPLAPIRTGIEVLKLEPARELVHRTLGAMERQASHMVRLVDDLMDVSRIRRGIVELKRERVQLRTIVEEAVETSQTHLQANGHAFEVNLPAEPIWIDGDLTRLAQVLSNLLNNSAKYTPFGGRVQLAALREEDHVEISVVDNGVGISVEDVPHVFDLFAQVGATLDRSQGGLGIGLSLVRQLVALHDGTVDVQSAGLGRGSVFRVRLPVAASAPAAEAAAVPSDGQPCPPQVRRVLVVDDNRDAAELLAEMLSLAGHVTQVAHDGPAALAAAPAFAPHVILLDLGLPGMDGYEVARQLRSGGPPTRHTVLIALTGWGSAEDKRRSAEAGFDYHLTKPVQLSAITEVLARSLAQPTAPHSSVPNQISAPPRAKD